MRLRFDDGFVGLEYARGDLHRAGLETEGGLGVAGLQFELEEHPDIVGQFE